jgi:hypothetical protein
MQDYQLLLNLLGIFDYNFRIIAQFFSSEICGCNSSCGEARGIIASFCENASETGRSRYAPQSFAGQVGDESNEVSKRSWICPYDGILKSGRADWVMSQAR